MTGLASELLGTGVVPGRNHVAGEWVAAGATFEVVDPATGDPVGAVPDAGPADALEAVAAAAAALPVWSARSPRERADVLRRAYELMREREESLADLVVAENGKVYADALGEVRYAAEFLRWYAEEAVRVTGTLGRAPAGGNRILVGQRPVGVCLLVTPWNFPAAMITRKVGPALAAGCTVVVKPAEETPLTALALSALLAEAGADAGVLNVVCTSRPAELVGAVLADPRVRKLSFTGSTEVGRLLLATAAPQVISCSMELGGNAPFLVLDDADLDAAVAGAMVAKMRNGGEACTSANRFLVHEAVAADFSRRLAAAMGGLRMGPGADRSSEVGPLITAEARDRVAGLVDEAVGRGGRLLAGGTVPTRPGFFYPPTVVSEVPADAATLRTEIFGPVAPLVTVGSDADAVAAANDSEYGLVAYLYTRDVGRGLALAERLDFGMVGLNRGLVSDPAAPFGGVKQSGLGREGGHEGLLEYLEPQYVAVDW